jgi:hypothetical protein
MSYNLAFYTCLLAVYMEFIRHTMYFWVKLKSEQEKGGQLEVPLDFSLLMSVIWFICMGEGIREQRWAMAMASSASAHR